MSNFFIKLRMGLALLAIILTEIPMILLDGKVTIKELAELIEQICNAADMRIYFEIPPDLMNTVIGAKEPNVFIPPAPDDNSDYDGVDRMA